MKNKKFQDAVLISILMLSVALSACKKDDEFLSEQKLKRRTSAIHKREMDTYYRHIFDSVYNADLKEIQEKIGGKLPNETRPVYQDRADMKMFQDNATLSSTMDNEILSTGQGILNKYYMQLSSELKKHNIDASSVQRYFIAHNVKDLLFIGVGEQFNHNNHQIGRMILDNINNDIIVIIDNSRCSADERENTKLTVSEILSQMEQSLVANRKNIEQKYSDYYLLNEYGQMSLGLTQHNSATTGSYKMLDWLNGKYLITKQSTELYATNLLPDFFLDQNATYRAILIAPGKWCVSKTLQNGDVILSDSFFDNAVLVQNTDISDIQTNPGTIEFNYVPYGNGTKIIFAEIINVEQRKKDWSSNLSDGDKQKSDSLQAEINRKNKMEYELHNAWIRADSIARAATLYYFDVVNEK